MFEGGGGVELDTVRAGAIHFSVCEERDGVGVLLAPDARGSRCYPLSTALI